MSDIRSTRRLDKQVQATIEYAKGLGFEFVGVRKSGHLRLRIPGGPQVTISMSPSSQNAHRAQKADLRRAHRKHHANKGAS